ncbi:MAG: hypothetical protein M1296_01935 [Chloroflexi bacterium]|nr:hypothetical protein [Chloroflexota bacterium]
MGFFKKLLGGSDSSASTKVPKRPEPETLDAVELAWKTLQDLVDEINKGGPSGSLVGIPLQQRVKLRDEITAIGERLGTDRAAVKSRHAEYTAKSIGGILRDLATLAGSDPFCQFRFDPDDPQSPTVAQRCAAFAGEVEALERQVEHTRKIEHDQRKL